MNLKKAKTMHELVEFLNQHDVVKAFGLSLLHSVWQAAIIAALLWILLKITTRLSARLRYWFALTALCSLLLCFNITLNTQLYNLSMAGSIVEEVDTFIISTSEARAQPPLEKTFFQEIEAGWHLLLYRAHLHIGYFFLAWTLGAFLFSFRFFTGLYYLRDLKQQSSPLPDSWSVKVNRLKQMLGLDKNIELLASGRAGSPLTFGWLRPVIIFPLSMVSLLPDEQVESILLHELAHIRRNDYLVNLLQSIIEILFFFNPGYWFISKVLEREREHICDDMVLAHSPDPHIYARALIRLAELSAFHSSPLAMNIACKDHSLLFRIKRIIQPSKSYIMERSVKRRSYQLASLIVACSLLVFLTIDVNGNNGLHELSQKDEEKPPTTETGKQITGLVLSKYGGSSIPGVAITVKNSSTGTVTDFEGNYSISAQPEDTLVFSFVGFHKKEIAVNKQDYYPVILENIEKKQNSRLILEDIEVRENTDEVETTYTATPEGSSGNNARKTVIAEVESIFIIPEEANIKIFGQYITSTDLKVADLQQHGRKISRGELEAIDPSTIKSNLTISSEETGQKRSVTIIKLKGAEDETAVSSSVIQDPQPIYIILEENMFNASTLSPEEYKKAFREGRQLSNPDSIDPESIASIQVLKNEKAVEYLGEAAKNGVIFITVRQAGDETKPTNADTTGKAAITIKGQANTGPTATATMIPGTSNTETTGTVTITEAKAENARPLYVLLDTDVLGTDPGPEEYKAAFASGRQPGNVQALDPATIASMHVLKDASASALGETARNGVVFITLKQSANTTLTATNKAGDRFEVFPNPAAGVVKVSFLNNSKQHVTAEVLDPNGNKLHTFTNGILEKGTYEYEWTTDRQEAGLYTILLKRGKEVQTTRLVLE